MFLLFTRLLEDIHILKELWQRKGRENNAWTVSKDTGRYVPGSKLLWFPYKRGWSQVPLQSTTLPAFQKFLPSKGEALIMGCKKRIANKASEVKHNPWNKWWLEDDSPFLEGNFLGAIFNNIIKQHLISIWKFLLQVCKWPTVVDCHFKSHLKHLHRRILQDLPGSTTITTCDLKLTESSLSPSQTQRIFFGGKYERSAWLELQFRNKLLIQAPLWRKQLRTPI